MTCGWGFVLPAGGHWVENGSGVQGEAGVCLRCALGCLGKELTLDAEAELLLLVGDVAGDSPNERHDQAAGNAGDCPCLCHCGAQRELCDGHTHHPFSLTIHCDTYRCCSRCRCCHWHLQRHNPVSIPATLCSPHCCAGREETHSRGVAGQPWPGGGQMPLWDAAFLLPHTPLSCSFLLLRALKLLLSLYVCMGRVLGDPLHGTPLPVSDNYPHPHLLHLHCSVPREHLKGCPTATQHTSQGGHWLSSTMSGSLQSS